MKSLSFIHAPQSILADLGPFILRRMSALRGGRLSCKPFTYVAPSLALLFLVGCGPSPINLNFPQASAPLETILAPGDEIEVKFRHNPELDIQQFIRPDGAISLMFVNDVQAAGLTPQRLQGRLVEVHAPYLKDPVITVIVRALADRRVFVAGQVRTPGVVVMPAPMTILQAIAQSGGFINYSSNVSNVVLIRQIGTRRYATAIDMRKAYEEPESDIHYLAPNDIVFVGRKGVDSVNQWVDQYISRMLPNPFGLGGLMVP
jgi:polysaccharide export outer membrane protein